MMGPIATVFGGRFAELRAGYGLAATPAQMFLLGLMENTVCALAAELDQVSLRVLALEGIADATQPEANARAKLWLEERAAAWRADSREASAERVAFYAPQHEASAETGGSDGPQPD